MDYWYLGVLGNQLQLFVDSWGNFVTPDGDVVNVDNAGNITDDQGNWVGTLYGDTSNFLEETRDGLLAIPSDALNRAAVTIPVTIAVTGLIIVWYFFRR